MWSVAVKTHVVHYFGMKRSDPQFKIRLPDAIKERLEALAAKEQRSVSAEIVARLQRTLDEDQARASQPLPEEVAALLDVRDEGLAKALAEMGALARRLEELTAPLKLAPAQNNAHFAAKKTTRNKAP